MENDLAKRSIKSIKWISISNILQITINFIRSVAVARLLPIETIGIYSGALALTTLFAGFSNFGLPSAFIHRCKETNNLEETSYVFFTLRAIINVIWLALMLGGGILLIKEKNDGYFLSFVVISVSLVIENLVTTPMHILTRQVKFERIALINIVTVLSNLFFTLLLITLNQPIWALLSTGIVRIIVEVLLLHFWKPFWRPKFLLIKSTINYYLDFGSKQVLSNFLSDALENFDDVWTKTYLGSTQMGLYSRAYSLAEMPSIIISNPISAVSANTFAEIAQSKEGLREAFHRTLVFLIQTGFLAAGALFIAAPEVIFILLGEKWMPMVTIFRTMLPFTFFYPMKKSIMSTFVALGKPEVPVRIRFVQLVVMTVLLFILGKLFQTVGVAIAVDLMMLVGFAMGIQYLKRYIDFSFFKMIRFSLLGFGCGIGATFFVESFIMNGISSILFLGFLKLIVYTFVFVAILLIFDFKELKAAYKLIRKYI